MLASMPHTFAILSLLRSFQKCQKSAQGNSQIIPFYLSFNIFRIFQEILFHAIRYRSGGVVVFIENGERIRIIISGDLAEETELNYLNQIRLDLRLPDTAEASLNTNTNSQGKRKIELFIKN